MEQETATGIRAVSKITNLQVAWLKLNRSNKKSVGVDGESIGHFGANLHPKLLSLSKSLQTKTFKFSPLRATTIPKDKFQVNGDRRPLRIPTVKDRIVLKALQIHLTEPLNRYNAPFSYAYRPKGGVFPAILHAQYLASKFHFVLHADIKQYFDNVDRTKLFSVLQKTQRFSSLAPLLKEAIELETIIGPNVADSEQSLFEDDERGIPQGSALSPLLANLFLAYFDLSMSEKGWAMLRYADDICIFSNSKDLSEKAYKDAREILNTLDLDMHPLSESFDSKTHIREIKRAGVEFVGLRVHGNKIFPSGKTVHRFRKEIEYISNMGTLGQGIKRSHSHHRDNLITRAMLINNKVEGKVASLACCDDCQEIQQLDKIIRERYLGMFDYLGLNVTGKAEKLLRQLGVPKMIEMWKEKHEHFFKKPPIVIPDENIVSNWINDNTNILRRVFETVMNSPSRKT